jgi:NAD(P)-dependent dehydrogenase (short-subunit alcohol dehydrogenase family)
MSAQQNTDTNGAPDGFDGARYLVIGASGGIGGALCRRLAAGGARVVAAGRSAEALERLRSDLDCETLKLDGTDLAAVEDTCADLAGSEDGLYGIANCAGSILLKPAHLTTAEEWQDTLATNLQTAFAVVRGGAKAMMKSGGAIALVSSAAASVGLANHEAIAAAKGGIVGLTLAAAATYASNGIRFNCVAPGLTETRLTERITQSDKARKVSESMHPLGRLGRPEEVASALAWLLSPRQGWVTGQIIGVDGGLATVRSRDK